jgi:hypothetical protein
MQHSLVRKTFLVLAFLIPGVFGEAPPDKARPPAGVWFDDLPALNAEDAQSLAGLVRPVFAAVADAKTQVVGMPESLRHDRLPRLVFLSWSLGTSPAAAVYGSGQGIQAALEDALSRLVRAKEPLAPGPCRWLKLDVVAGVQPPEALLRDKSMLLEPGLQGIAFARATQAALLAEELLASSVMSDSGKVDWDALSTQARQRWPGETQDAHWVQSPPLEIRRFRCISFFCDGEQVVPLYRGHRRDNLITPKLLLDAARAAGAYLIRSVNPDGRFAYIYRPETDTVAPSYNLVRHAGTLYSMWELYAFHRNRELRAACERATQYMLKNIRPFGPRQLGAKVLVGKDEAIKLGGVALAIVSLAKCTTVTRDMQYLPLMKELGRYLQDSQFETGAFAHERVLATGERLEFESEYYPGEAIFGLVRLYPLDSNPEWLDMAEKAARYLIAVRDRGKSNAELNHDHWLLYGLNELYLYRPKALYLEHANRIATAMCDKQHRRPEYPDYLGGYYIPPRSTPTATRSEGLVAAYLLSRDFGNREDETRRILSTIALGTCFQLQVQFHPEKAMYLKNPQRCLGAFHGSLTNLDVRIDYLQHNISALLGLYQIMSAEGLESLSGEVSPASE